MISFNKEDFIFIHFLSQRPTADVLVATAKICSHNCTKCVYVTSRFSHGEQDQESNHQTEEPHGFRQSKTQDGVREELLL